jgi:hypothetical protein
MSTTRKGPSAASSSAVAPRNDSRASSVPSSSSGRAPTICSAASKSSSRLRASRAAEVAAIQDKESVANPLEDFSRRGLQPFDMFRAVVPALGNVYFTVAIAEGQNNLSIDGNAPNIADYNNFFTALRGIPQVQNVVEKKPPQSREITTFSLNVTFKPDAFPRPTVPAVASAAAPEGPRERDAKGNQ